MALVHYCPVCLTTFREEPEACPNLSCGKAAPKAGWGRLLGEGDLLDRHYKIERALAVGGAGLTYLARKVDGDGVPQPPDLAIKVLYHARATGSFLTRLSTEAQILQELNHENIIQLRGFVHRAGSEPYLVTLFEKGGTLTHHIEAHGALSVRVAAAILIQILSALNVAHQRGVVHRDLKPDNVLLEAEVGADEIPHVRVADFGIAKVAGSLTSQVTKMGTFVGTPEYAAPEQFDGTPPTPAADVFAAGALFLHMLTGRVPVVFSNRNDVEACRTDWLAALPPTLEAKDLHDVDPVTASVVIEVLRKMLARHPEQRWTVHQVLKPLRGVVSGEVELQPLRETLEVTVGPPPARREEVDFTPPSRDGWGAAFAGLGVLVAGALIAASLIAVFSLSIAAWQTGYFTGNAGDTGPTPSDPVPDGPSTRPAPTDRWASPTPSRQTASSAEREVLGFLSEEDRFGLQGEVQSALEQAPPCSSVEGVVLASLWIADSRLVKVESTPMEAASCLEEALRGLPLGEPGRARLALYF